MPKSKRNKVVSLTKTASKGRELKMKMIEGIREHVGEHEHIYVVSYSNMRASRFKDIRMDWRESTIYLGKVAVAMVALGRGEEDEYMENLHQVSANLSSSNGQAGLLFTSRPKKEVVKYFKQCAHPEYALAGFVPKADVVIPVGPLNEVDAGINAAMSDHLRKLGMIVEIENGLLVLKDPYVAAQANVPLTPEQAKVLEHIKQPLATFSVKLGCHWSKAKCAFEEL